MREFSLLWGEFSSVLCLIEIRNSDALSSILDCDPLTRIAIYEYLSVIETGFRYESGTL